MDHVNHLLFVMAGLGCPIIIHHREGHTDHAVDLAGLATAVALPMEGGKTPHHLRRKFRFATQEDAIPWDEDIIKDEGWAVFGIPDVPEITAIKLPCI